MLYESSAFRNIRSSAISQRLHDRTMAHIPKHAATHGGYSKEYEAIDDYTGSGSSRLNFRLIKGEQLRDDEQKMHETIKDNARPIGEHLKLYSGTSEDFGKMARQSKDGILHSPAHLSTTHHLRTAIRFSKFSGSDDPGHMLVIHAKPSDKGLHVSKSGVGIGIEHETIIPAGTKLKHIKTEHKIMKEERTDMSGRTYFNAHPTHIHHFEIHSQED